MSVPNPVVHKSFSECEIKEENELRINNSELPSDENSSGFIQPRGDVINDKILEISSDTQCSNEYETCEDNDLSSQSETKIDDNLELNSDTQNDATSTINEFDSSFADTLQTFSVLSNETANPFPHSLIDKFQNESPFAVDKSPPPILSHSQETSPFGSSSSSYNLICNKSPSSAVSQTFDIPLPGQNFDYVPSPKLSCNIKSPTSDSSVKIPTYALSLNLKSPKSDLDMDSCETIAEPIDNSTDSKSLTPVIDVSDIYLSLDSTEKKKLDSSRYSPTRLDSDEENQEFTTTKPKVLGKEQAKKRLMAFSLSRQSNTPVVKKQNKLLISQKSAKEKPPNPNKSVGVQEQFRATISAIEEEKKKMMQNMPNYLLMYTNSLGKVGDAPVLNPVEKSIKDGDIDINVITKMIMEKDDKDDGKSKSGQLSPSRSGSLAPRSGISKRRQTKEVHEKNDDMQLKKMESVHNWKSFAESGFALDSDFRRLKFRWEEMQKQKDRSKRFWAPGYKALSDYKPIFNYSSNYSTVMVPLKAKTQKPRQFAPFKEKTVKYTMTKPVITWAENPSYATDFYMPKQMLLENCDKNISCILYDILEQRGETYVEMKKPRQRYWYPQFNYLTEIETVEDIDTPDDKFDATQTKEGETKEYDEDDSDGIGREESSNSEWKQKTNGREKGLNWELEQCDLPDEKYEIGLDYEDSPIMKPKERRINLANSKYSSLEENKRNPVKELFVGDVKVQLDLGLNSVKVKSKWDSDYDDEDENGSWNGIEKPEGKRTSMGVEVLPGEYDKKSLSANGDENFSKSPALSSQFISNQTNTSVNDSQSSDFLFDGGKLASEYEEFMRLVSGDADNMKDVNSGESPFEKMKKKSSNSAIRLIMSDNKNNKNIDPTDWDLESDREEKLYSKKIDSVKEDTTDGFSLLLSGYDSKIRKKSKSPSRKKSGKFKSKDKSKKSSKNKKKKYKEISSSESSSDSSDSGSDSDSSDSEDERRKKKKKRIKKYKKKYSSSSTSSSTSSTSSTSSSYSSSSDSKSDSDSKRSKSKKSRRKKKKNKIKKNLSGQSSGSDDETGSVMLKQLDLKKQQIIKKIEEIDSLDVTMNKKKKPGTQGQDENFESEIGLKEGKRRGNVKNMGSFDESKENPKETEEMDKSQKTEKFDASQMEIEDGTMKGKKRKKSQKQKWSSESSSDGEEKENRRTKKGKNLKGSRKKKTEYRSSSDSDSSSYSRKSKKSSKRKKKKKESKRKSFTKNMQELPNWNDHLLSDGPDFKSESLVVGENLSWLNNNREWNRRQKNAIDDPHKDGEGLKDLGDWENSSVEESPKERQSRESTWDEELPMAGLSKVSKEDTKNENKEVNFIRGQLVHDDRNKFLNEFNLESKRDLLFIDSRFSNLDQEASRDSYSRENSSSTQLFPSATEKNCNLNISYQFEETLHGVGDELSKEKTKPSKDELYSPGHTDSDLSDENEMTECRPESEIRPISIKQEIYDPVISGVEVTGERHKVEVNAIPLPSVSDILLPGEIKKEVKEEKLVSNTSLDSCLPRSDFIAIPLAKENEADKNIVSATEKSVVLDFTSKKRMISVKLQQKFQSKVASVFQSDSEDEVETVKKGKTANGENETASKGKILTAEVNVKKEISKEDKKLTEEGVGNDSSRRRGRDKVYKSRWSSDSYKENSDKYISPRRRSPSPDPKYSDLKGGKWKHDKKDVRKEKDMERRSPRLKTERNSDNGSKKSDEVTEKDIVRPIPVLTGLDVRMSNGLPWNRSHMLGSEDIGFSCDHLDLMNPNMDPYKLYESPDGKLEGFLLDDRGHFGLNYGHDIQGTELDVLLENRIRMDKRKSRSKSGSPRKRRRSKTPDKKRSPRNRSPKGRSTSPRRKGRSPFSPRRRGSPRGRRYKTSRSPERKKSRSPRKRRHSPSRRSRSISPKKHRDRMDSPRRRSMSPGKDSYHEIGVRNLIHLTGIPDDENRDLCSSKYDSPMGFTRSLADSTISDSELNNAFYSRDYPGEYGSQNYPEVTVNNLITVQNHDADKQTDSPKRLPLDQRLEMELGVPTVQGDQYQISHQSYQQFPEHANQYSNSYQCDDGISQENNNSQNFYSTQNSDYNGQYFNGQPPSNFDQYQQYPCHNHPPPTQNSVLQVGNIMEVVPTLQSQLPPSTVPPHSKGHQIMQVGNVLQVVPSPKPAHTAPFGYGANLSPGKNQKESSLSVNSMPNPEAIINPLIKAIQLEREKRKKEKEKRRLEREARRKARQLKREAKMMSVNEKLKKSVQDEGLMLGQEVEEDELLEEVEHPSPPVPVEIITDSSHSSLPPAGKGILITAGFIPRPASEKKEVKFADGICPGEGTSTSGGEDRASPPPKPKLPKEKRYKKKKTKLKKKVKVHIIRQVIQDDEEEDDLSPPPPPPGDPPPVFFAKFPFGIKAQYPVYHSQTTTTTFTTVQFPSETF